MSQQVTHSGTNDQSKSPQSDWPVAQSTAHSDGGSHSMTKFLRARIPSTPQLSEVTEIKLEVEEEEGYMPTTFVSFPTSTKISQLEKHVENLRQEFNSIREISRRIENNWNTALDVDLNLDVQGLLNPTEDWRPSSSLASIFSHEENPDADGVARSKNIFSALNSSLAPVASTAPATTTCWVESGFSTFASLPMTDSVQGSPLPSTSSCGENFSAQSPPSAGPPLIDHYPSEPMDLPNDNESSCDPGHSRSKSSQRSRPMKSSLRTFRKGTRSSPRLQKKDDAFDEVAKLSGAPTDSTHSIDASKSPGFYCTCGVELASRSGLSGHVRYFTQEWKFKCSVCKVSFFAYNELRNHNAKSHQKYDNFGDNASGCSKCGMVFSSRLLCNRHHSRAHLSKSRVCQRRG